MALKQKELAIAMILLIGIAFYSYYRFTEYRPKSLRQLQEVKGDKSDVSNSMDLPYPERAERISITKTAVSEQITFKTIKSTEEINEYYKNVLTSLEWELESEGIYDGFSTTKFKKNDYQVTVLAFSEDDGSGSLVGLEIFKD